MAGRYEDEARREIEQQETFRRWISARIDVIHQTVTAADVLQKNGVKLRYSGQRAEQMYCPFHGNTRTQAARFHPADNRKPDHVWCFVCNEQWDSIALFKKFEGHEGKFSALLRHMERDYGITPPDAPTSVPDDEPAEHELAEVLSLIEICERRLRTSRHAFDMKGYLVLGSVLDRAIFGVDSGSMPIPKVREALQKVLEKIATKVRECPEG